MRMQNLDPSISENGDMVYDVFNQLAKKRTLFLDCEIDQEITTQITSLLFLLDQENSEEVIKLWINCPGGIVNGFFAIYDMMQRIKSPIQTICMGEACSAAAILLSAGSAGLRCCMPNSRVMIHQIQVDGLGGSNSEIELNTKELKAVQNQLTDILSKHTGHNKSKIKRDTKMDRWFSAQEAVNYGLVDYILLPNKTIKSILKE